MLLQHISLKHPYNQVSISQTVSNKQLDDIWNIPEYSSSYGSFTDSEVRWLDVLI